MSSRAQRGIGSNKGCSGRSAHWIVPPCGRARHITSNGTVHLTASMRTYWVYVLASRSRVIYVGVTGNLIRRVAQHRAGEASRFTARYGVVLLVYVESTDDVLAALRREKQIKAWRRSKKVALIESLNPQWEDLMPVVIPTERSDRGSARYEAIPRCARDDNPPVERSLAALGMTARVSSRRSEATEGSARHEAIPRFAQDDNPPVERSLATLGMTCPPPAPPSAWVDRGAAVASGACRCDPAAGGREHSVPVARQPPVSRPGGAPAP